MNSKMQAATAAMALAISLAAPTSAHALRVVKDIATGELRAPNAAEAAAFEAAEAQLRQTTRASGGKETRRITGIETRYPDGTVETSLGDDTHMYSVVSTAADGSLQMDCVPAAEAQKLMKPSKTPSRASNGAAPAVKANHVHQ